MLRPDLCDYSDACIVVKGVITVQTKNNKAIDGYNRNLILNINATFTNCISKINNVLIDNAEDLDVVMPIYNLILYSKNYLKTSGNLKYYYKDILVDSLANSESFKYKTSITGKTADDENTKEVEFSVQLKYLSNFRRILDMPLINCEVSLTLTWSKNCVITDEKTS